MSLDDNPTYYGSDRHGDKISILGMFSSTPLCQLVTSFVLQASRAVLILQDGMLVIWPLLVSWSNSFCAAWLVSWI